MSDEMFQIIVEGYQDLMQHAKQAGLKLIMENHWGANKTPENVVKILESVEGLGLLFDSNNWPEGRHEESWERCAKYANSVHIKTFAFDANGNETTVNIPKVVSLLREAGYQGAWGIESIPKDGDEYTAVEKTKAAKYLIEMGKLGKIYHARSTGFRRRGRPYVDGYGSAFFVKKEFASGGALYDMGVYHIAQILYLLGNPMVKTITGSVYQETPLDEARASGYNVEVLGLGYVRFTNGVTLDIIESWAIHLDGIEGSVIVGSEGGVRLNPSKLPSIPCSFPKASTCRTSWGEKLRQKKCATTHNRLPFRYKG